MRRAVPLVLALMAGTGTVTPLVVGGIAGQAESAPDPEAGISRSPGVETAEAPAPSPAAGVRPAGLAGYEGSDFCRACHPGPARSWDISLHARTIREPDGRESALLRSTLLCGDHDALFVLGERHARRFMVPSPSEPGMHVLLPCRYEVGSAEWTYLHEDDWKDLTWERSCGACHTTGFSSDDFGYREMRVGCESCHGPADRHGNFTSRERMLVFRDLTPREEVTVCASCHLQGGLSRRTGLNFASNYRAGGDLFSDYDFDWNSLDPTAVKDGNPIDIHQKLLIRDHVMPASAASTLRCTSCHTIHENSHSRHESLPKEAYCHLCHAEKDFALKEYNQACNVCEF